MTGSSNAISQQRAQARSGVETAKWLPPLAARTRARIRLFCFPYAGGDAISIFRRWPVLLPWSVEVRPVQIPGRGSRLAEPLLKDLPSVVQGAGEAIRDYQDKPFALFGHSMGALIAFELARFLRQQCGVEPQVLFVSGRRAPHLADPDPPTYDLPEAAFLEEVKRFKGTPDEVLEHPELMELIMPVLKADFRVCETYTYSEQPPLGCPIVTFGGLADEPTRADLDAWKQHTAKCFSLHLLPGDHFFLRAHEETLLRIIAARMGDGI